MSKTVLALESEKEPVYEVGDRVLFVVLVNDPGYMKPGDKISGTIISVFEACGMRIYRIELDMRWDVERHPREKGAKIIVGNLYSRQIRSL